MMKTPWIISQVILSLHFWFPMLLLIIASVRKFFQKRKQHHSAREIDFGIIVTAYQQVDLLDDVVFSILQNNYENYLIYIVADDCNVANIKFSSDKVVLLRPEKVLGSNTRSHFYAIQHFKRKHQIVTIIDSDNIVHKKYLENMNKMFQQGSAAVQGLRTARNLNTTYARLDEIGDIYYRYIDRKLLFEAGSSSSLAGSGMAFTLEIFTACMQNFNKTGAGFDKVLQYELVSRGERIVFNENAIVYDGKTSKSDQLVKQRARWINTWFRYWALSLKLFIKSLVTFNWNRFSFSIMLLRPPLFILVFFSFLMMVLCLIMQPVALLVWAAAYLCFIIVFFKALNYFTAGAGLYRALGGIPKFVFCQVQALFKARQANKLSVATKHDAAAYKKNDQA